MPGDRSLLKTSRSEMYESDVSYQQEVCSFCRGKVPRHGRQALFSRFSRSSNRFLTWCPSFSTVEPEPSSAGRSSLSCTGATTPPCLFCCLSFCSKIARRPAGSQPKNTRSANAFHPARPASESHPRYTNALSLDRSTRHSASVGASAKKLRMSLFAKSSHLVRTLLFSFKSPPLHVSAGAAAAIACSLSSIGLVPRSCRNATDSIGRWAPFHQNQEGQPRQAMVCRCRDLRDRHLRRPTTRRHQPADARQKCCRGSTLKRVIFATRIRLRFLPHVARQPRLWWRPRDPGLQVAIRTGQQPCRGEATRFPLLAQQKSR
ncbi:hypothetical protein DFJ73DRAFT_868722 [Zopfochytrium polystomum]|nr:hypothetical protein DFJ73DRAFT_868722 [Zopfochytrium polystomum]